MRRGISNEVKEKALRLVRGGMSFSAAADEVSVSDTTVSIWCRAAGLAAKSHSPRRFRYSEETARQAVEAVRGGATYAAAARRFGIGEDAVCNLCRKAGVQSPLPSFRTVKEQKEALDPQPPHVHTVCAPRSSIQSAVEHPAHYEGGFRFRGCECIQVARHLPFALGCAVKYIWRAGRKGGPRDWASDLLKARWYIRDAVMTGIMKSSGTACWVMSLVDGAGLDGAGRARLLALNAVCQERLGQAAGLVGDLAKELGVSDLVEKEAEG